MVDRVIHLATADDGDRPQPRFDANDGSGRRTMRYRAARGAGFAVRVGAPVPRLDEPEGRDPH